MADRMDDGADEATQAFRELTREVADVRAELSVMRRAVEGIGPALSGAQPPDYSPTLGQLSKNLHAVALRVDAIEKHTAAKLSPEAFEREMRRTRDEVLRPFRDGLEGARREVIEAASYLRDAGGVVRQRHEQHQQLVRTALGGLVVGLIAFPLMVFPLARVLPGRVDEGLALTALGQGGWEAGGRLMAGADLAGYQRLIEADRLMRSAGEELRACQENAAKTSRDQRCTVTVKAQSR